MTEPLKLDLAAIRARAEAATPGPWFATQPPWFCATDGVVAGSPDGNVAFTVAECDAYVSRDDYTGPFKTSDATADAAYIATMDPPTTIALLNEMESLVALANAVGVRADAQEDLIAEQRMTIDRLRARIHALVDAAS